MKRPALNLLALAAITCATLVLSACGGGSSAASDGQLISAAGQRGAFGVGVTTIDLVDASRGTAANGNAPASDTRKLTTEVWYPADPSVEQPEARDVAVDRRAAPYPLVIFAHALSSFSRQSASYTQQLASHGYVVAAPTFPLSNIAAAGGPRLDAVLEQPKDVSFVIDSLLKFNDQSGHLLNGAIDAKKIGMTGHSLGALTTMLTIYGADRDPRIAAALPFSVPGCFLPDGFSGENSVPLIIVSGTSDLLTPPASNDRAYQVAKAPRYLVHILGADHVRFADVDITDMQLGGLAGLQAALGQTFTSDAIEVATKLGGNVANCPAAPSPSTPAATVASISGDEQQRQLLRTIAVPFFDAYLRGDKPSRALLTKLPELLPGITLQSEP